jgi:2-methylcitrate dehydratase
MFVLIASYAEKRFAMLMAHELASFVVNTSYRDMSDQVVNALKIRVMDSIGCAIGAIGSPPIRMILSQIIDFESTGHCTLIAGGKASPDRAAFYNSALVRFLDFNDSFLAPNETCHPSDNLGAVLAATEYADGDGADFLLALAVAYQVQCRLSEVAPVRNRGFDHVTQGAFALAAGISRALGLDEARTTNAIGICGTAFNALRVTRTGALSNWKGLAYPNAAFCATHATFLAMRGITGPMEVFEGNKGFMDSISGRFEIEWKPGHLNRVLKTILKRYNAEIHSQSTLEGILELKSENGFTAEDVDRIEIETFDVAYNIIGGGEEGVKTVVRSKEQADHSLHYMIAVAILDDQVLPPQYADERILRDDVQELLTKIDVLPSEAFSRRFPEEMPCRIRIVLKNGVVLIKEKKDYEGFTSRPMTWEAAAMKFHGLSEGRANLALRTEILQAINQLESLRIRDFMRLLSEVRSG